MKDTTPIHDDEGHAAPARFKKILAPTDFSACADQAFAYALDLARRHGAEVDLLHVIGPVEGDAYSPLRYSPEARVQQKTPDKIVLDHLQAVIEKHPAEGVTVEPVKQHGSTIVSTLLQYARTEGVDLIVMGTHGRRGVQRFLIGSVAERTVRLSPCSVLTVREQGAPASPAKEPGTLQIQRILVPLDFSRHSEALLRSACAWAVAFEARLDLLHVIEMPLMVGIFSGIMTANDLVPDIQEQSHRKLRHLWEQVKGKGKGEGVEARLHVEEGHAAAHIVDFAARCGTDLIVIASQGHSGVERFLIGSVTERVVRTALCPVLTFKTLPAGAAPRRALLDCTTVTMEAILPPTS